MDLDEAIRGEPQPRRRPWWRRWLRRLAISLLMAAGIGAARYAWWRHGVHERLAAAIAELDAADPGWRLADIEAARAEVPEAENSALVVVATGKLLPPRWPPREFSEAFARLSPPERLSPAASRRLRKGLDEVGPAVAEARKLAGMPHGRHRIEWARLAYTTPLLGQEKVRVVASLLAFDAMRCGDGGDLPGALSACRAAFYAGRSIGDEPLAISQLIRIATFTLAENALERTLAQGEPLAGDLERFQLLLEEEDRFLGLLVLVRGERAMMHQGLEALESGDITASQIAGAGRKASSWEDLFLGPVARDRIRDDHPQMFPLMADYLEIARLPPHEREAPVKAFEEKLTELYRARKSTISLVFPALNKLEPSDRRHHANVRSLNVALACERYRLRHNSWPDSLDRLVPDFLAAVPLDPFDGERLRYRRLDDGVVVYSVGPDHRDDGGAVHGELPGEPGSDVGFRLWDVAQRRQPPVGKASP